MVGTVRFELTTSTVSGFYDVFWSFLMFRLIIDLRGFSSILIVFWLLILYHVFGHYGSKMVADNFRQFHTQSPYVLNILLTAKSNETICSPVRQSTFV
jgi:hypothetical protein